MSNIQLTTLTPVHVGSGEFLQFNADFIEEKDGEDSYLYVVEPSKILELIGTENLDRWISIIDNNGNFKEFLQKFPNAKNPENYASRKVLNYASNIEKKQTLREMIHNGFGFPYIPGSSLKGAIRTAVLASLTRNVANKEEKIRSKERNGKTTFTDSKIQKELFGNDAKNDLFRFVEVGDAYFEKGTEAAYRMIHLKKSGKDAQLEDKMAQIVEAVELNKTASFRLKINLEKYRFSKEKWPLESRSTNIKLIDSPKDLPECLQSVENLFQTINAHTLKLVRDEIKIWKNTTDEAARNYFEIMESIATEIDNCEKGKECILRLGYGSGWRFITGAWAENLDNFKSQVFHNVFSDEDTTNHQIYPKTRRVEEDYQDLLGFVKLKILE